MTTSHPRSTQTRRRVRDSGSKLWPMIFFLIIAGVLAYWNSFDVPFVFDDFLSIQANQGVRQGLYLDPSSLISFGNRQLLYFTFSVNYAISGMEVWGYHLVNLLLHLANGLLILLLAQHLFRKILTDQRLIRWYAFLSAGVFIVHPIQTGAVTYISSRSELLSTFFYILALFIFVKVPERRIGFALSLVVALLFVLGISSKETVISLPAALFLYDFIFLAKGRFKPMLLRWKFYSPFVVGGASVAVYLVTGPLSGAVGTGLAGHLTVTDYFFTQLRVIVRYLQLLFIPIGQNVDHAVPPSTSPFEPAVLFSGAILIAIVLFAWHSRFRLPIVSFSIFWFFVTLSPTSSFMPILDLMFEHRLYLPMVGLCMAFPIGLAAVVNFINSKTRLNIRVIPVAAIVVIAFILITNLRNEVWRDEIRLWGDVIAKAPDNSRAYNALAMAHFRRAEFDDALRAARAGLARKPEDKDHHRAYVDTIGNIYMRTGRLVEAAQMFRGSAVENEEEYPAFAALEYNNLGVVYQHMWKFLRENRSKVSQTQFEMEKARILKLAREAFVESIALDQSSTGPFDSYINVMKDLGREDEVAIQSMVKLEQVCIREDVLDRYALGKIAFHRNDWNTAVAQFEIAIEVDSSPRKKDTNRQLLLFNYAYALEQLNRIDKAIEYYMKAINSAPIFIEANYNVGLLYLKKKQVAEAIVHFEEVLDLYPDHAAANIQLAKIAVAQGNIPLARRHLQAVLAGAPDNQDALALWRQIGSS